MLDRQWTRFMEQINVFYMICSDAFNNRDIKKKMCVFWFMHFSFLLVNHESRNATKGTTLFLSFF